MTKPLRLSAVTTSQAPLTVADAVALASAVSHACESTSTGETMPSLDDILLDATGRVTFAARGPEAPERARVRDLAALLQLLLRLDGGPGAASPNVPGALLVLIARAAGTIDLPAPSLGAFQDALRRFGPSDPATTAAIYRRAIARPAAAATIPPLAPRAAARVPRRGALAASIVVAAVALAWGLSSDERRPTVSVVHEDTIVDVPAPSPQDGTESTPKPSPGHSRPAVTVTPLLSAAAIGTEAFSPSFGSHGRELLFHAGRTRGSLMRASFDPGGRPAITTVLEDGSANYHAAQSPDGRWLAFDSDRDGTRGVYVARSDFRDAWQARKISGEGYAAIPRWSPDGRRLAFVKAEAARPQVWNVWVSDLDTGRLSRVSRHRVGQAWGPSWFPGGAYLAYSVEDRLVVTDLRRGTARVLQSPRPGRLVRTPAVSPDGRWIVFQIHRDGAWLLDVATGRMRRVLDDARAEEFAWSPDGRRVIYHTNRSGAWSVWQLAISPST